MRKLGYLMLAISMVACTKELPIQENTPVLDGTVDLTAVAPPVVKVVASYDSGTYSLNWETNEQISVFDGVGNVPFTASGSGGEVVFKGSPSATPETWYAMTPYTENASLSGYSINTAIPTSVSVAPQLTSFPVIAAAKSSGSILEFTNVASVLKLSFSAEAAGTITKVVISGNNNEAVAGDFVIDCASVPTGAAGANTSKTITVTPSGGNTFAEGEYYVSILPVNMTEGLTLTFTRTDSEEIVKSSSVAADLSTPTVLSVSVPAVRTDVEKIESMLMANKWSVNNVYCLEEGGYDQPAAYNGDKMEFKSNGRVAYEDGGETGYVYCDMNGWAYPYEELLPTGEETWAVVDEAGKYYVQFSNGGFPLIVVDASNFNCKCEILSISEDSFQLKVVAETWGNYSYQVTYKPASEIPDVPVVPGEDESLVPESWAEGWWYHYFGDPAFGLTQDVPASFTDLTNPSELTGSTWALSDPGVEIIKYEGCLAIGDYKNQISEFTLSTKSFPGTVSLVCINFSSDGVPVTVSCSVGGVELQRTESDWTAAFSGEGTGELVIRFTPSASGGAIYFDELYIEGSPN